MNIAAIFIRRPVMTTLVMAAILLFGVMAYRMLPVSDLPSVDYPYIQVSAGLPGANPDTMAAAVATPLEKQFSTIAGLESMNSTSGIGSTQITLQFSMDRDIDACAQDVQAMIAKAQRNLPANMPTPPSYQKVNPTDQPILYLAINSPVLRLSDVDEYAQTMMAQRISMVKGVAQVQVYGTQKYAVRVQLDPNALASRKVGINEVADAVASANVNLPTGTLYGLHKAFTVQANGQLTEAAQYGPLIVSYRNGSPVRLRDVGRAIDSVENDKTANWYNVVGDPQKGVPNTSNRGIVLAILRQPGTNTVEVVDSIKKLLPDFRAQIPSSVSLDILFDRTESIRASVEDVKFTLILTVGLVILVIFLFLRSLSATVIPSLALPMSIIGTFAIMYAMGYSIDNLSLMALTLSVGFVVDDAIVMLENIVRHMEMGERPMQAALNGSREIGFTILSMTLSLAAVFIPVLFMTGIIGRLLHEFAVTITASILISGCVSLSLTPMLCSRFMRPPGEAHHGRVYAWSEKVFDGMLALYNWSLRGVLRTRPLTMLVLVGLFVATILIFPIIPKGFVPSEDTGRFMVRVEGPQGMSYQEMVAHQQQLVDIIFSEPSVESFMSNVGGNSGMLFVALKPRDQRPGVVEIVEKLRPKMAAVTGIRAYLTIPTTIPTGGGGASRALYQFTLQCPDTDQLYRAGGELEQKMRLLPQIQDVSSDLQVKNPQINVQFDRDKAAALGLNVQQIESALSDAYGSGQITTILAPNNQYQVLLELLPQYQRDPNALSMLYVRSSTGQLVPLSVVASLSTGVGPLQVSHMGQLPSVTVSFNLRPNVSLGEAITAVQDLAAGTLPSGIITKFQGTAQVFKDSFANMGILLLMAILVIYIVLGILYESFIHPITILTGLPAAGLGALVTLKLFGMELNLYSYVGIIMLVGIVKKNAIMMIDFALEAQRKEGKSPRDAIYEGCLIRFRPIMMTTMAALMGALPIALGYGAGGEARQPLGVAVVGGLVVSQLLTLYITPVFYTYMESLRAWFGRNRQHPAEIEEPAPEDVFAK